MAGSRTASKTAYPLPPDQDQRDRQEVRAHDLHPGLVRAAVVQERAPEPADSARSAGRPATSSAPRDMALCKPCPRLLHPDRP